MSDIIRQLNEAIRSSDTVFGDGSDLEDARDAVVARDAEIARLRDALELIAGSYAGPETTYSVLIMQIARAALKGGT